MNLFGLLDVSASALQAQRVRAEVVASNMANAETTRTEDGGPYRRHHVVFSAEDGSSFGAQLLNANGSGQRSFGQGSFGQGSFGQGSLPGSGLPGLGSPGTGSGSVPSGGVSIAGVIEDAGAPQMRYDPTHPDAGIDGFVAYPDINPLTEMVDLMGATRSYGLNASAVQAEKGMLSASLELLK
jgi:flagellar basal-body rod protein FlgC